jgi:hypothetical protein
LFRISGNLSEISNKRDKLRWAQRKKRKTITITITYNIAKPETKARLTKTSLFFGSQSFLDPEN